MNRRSWLLIGLALGAAGLLAAGLGYFAGGTPVRQVADIVAAPQAHEAGLYTMLGVPEPALVPVTTAQGVVLRPNADPVEATRGLQIWQADGVVYHSTHTLAAQPGATSGWTVFTLRNETRIQGRSDLAAPATQTQWSVPGTAFPVRGFQSGSVAPPVVWAVYEGVFKDPLQPKPSQFNGRVVAHAPDGTAIPSDLVVFHVDSYVAGCSSKFIPADEAQRLDSKYNGTV